MLIPDSYGEFINQIHSRSRRDGKRAYPAASYEVFLLDQARQRTRLREENLFRKLADIFDWKLSLRQRNAYIRKLQTGHTLVLTDPENAIIWASASFRAMTGYDPSEVLGRKPDLLQGPATDPAVVMAIRKALERAEPVTADLVNYRKNGEPYVCRVHIKPIYSNRQELTHFLAVESEVA